MFSVEVQGYGLGILVRVMLRDYAEAVRIAIWLFTRSGLAWSTTSSPVSTLHLILKLRMK